MCAEYISLLLTILLILQYNIYLFIDINPNRLFIYKYNQIIHLKVIIIILDDMCSRILKTNTIS